MSMKPAEATMTKTPKMTPIAIPAFTPALRLDEEGEEVREARAVEGGSVEAVGIVGFGVITDVARAVISERVAVTRVGVLDTVT